MSPLALLAWGAVLLVLVLLCALVGFIIAAMIAGARPNRDKPSNGGGA